MSDILKSFANLQNHLAEDQRRMDNFNREMNRQAEEVARKNSEKIQREKEMVLYLKEIVDNTSNLHEIVNLVRKNNEINEESIELIKDMHDMLKAKNEEEADTIFRKVLDKANAANTAVETITWLVNYGKVLKKLIFMDDDS